MKKIITLTMIKNEADIVEVFVRYTMSYAYKMYIIDNGCTDGTREIIDALIGEGLNIAVFNEANLYYEQKIIENKYLHIIANKEECDFIVPLDADEFLYPDNGDFSIIDCISSDKVSLVNWRTYCLTNNTVIRNPLEDIISVRIGEKCFTKVIIPSCIISDDLFISMGHHDIETNLDIDRILLCNITMAHFPVRSEKQIKLKLYQGILAQLMSSYHSVVAFHWKNMFEDLRRDNGEFDLITYSKEYALVEENLEGIQYKNDRLKYDWCKHNVYQKYTKYIKHDISDIVFDIAEVIAIRSIVGNEKFDCRLLIYGAGRGANTLSDLLFLRDTHIIAYIDSDPDKEYTTYNGRVVLSPEKIKYLDFDKILISCVDEGSIRNKLIGMGIEEDRIMDKKQLFKLVLKEQFLN